MEKKDHLSDDDEDKQNKQDAGCQDARWWWVSCFSEILCTHGPETA